MRIENLPEQPPIVVKFEIGVLEPDGIAIRLTYATGKERYENNQWETAVYAFPVSFAKDFAIALMQISIKRIPDGSEIKKRQIWVFVRFLGFALRYFSAATYEPTPKCWLSVLGATMVSQCNRRCNCPRRVVGGPIFAIGSHKLRQKERVSIEVQQRARRAMALIVRF
jgi:hypothetical protein